MATASVTLTNPFVLNITLNRLVNETTNNKVTGQKLLSYKMNLGVVASSTSNQIRIDASYLLARVSIVIDATKGTCYIYFPMAKKCLAQKVPLKAFSLSTFVDQFNKAGKASSFLVAAGAASKVHFNAKDTNQYYKYDITGVNEVKGRIYIGLTALSFYFDVKVDPSVIPAIPPV